MAYAIEIRFATSTNGTVRNNLADAPVHLRDRAATTQSGNSANASAALFVAPETGELHLRGSAAAAIDQAPVLNGVTNDFDGDPRPRGARSDIGADEFSTNSPPVIKKFSKSGTTGIVSFLSLTGSTYVVQRTDSLEPANWSSVKPSISGTGNVIDFSDPDALAKPQAFYRLRLE